MDYAEIFRNLRISSIILVYLNFLLVSIVIEGFMKGTAVFDRRPDILSHFNSSKRQFMAGTAVFLTAVPFQARFIFYLKFRNSSR